jgi:hypothetical protein
VNSESCSHLTRRRLYRPFCLSSKTHLDYLPTGRQLVRNVDQSSTANIGRRHATYKSVRSIEVIKSKVLGEICAFPSQ